MTAMEHTPRRHVAAPAMQQTFCAHALMLLASARPGMAKISEKQLWGAEKGLKKWEAMIGAMTPEEREEPDLLASSQTRCAPAHLLPVPRILQIVNSSLPLTGIQAAQLRYTTVARRGERSWSCMRHSYSCDLCSGPAGAVHTACLPGQPAGVEPARHSHPTAPMAERPVNCVCRRARVARESEQDETAVAEMVATFSGMREQMRGLLGRLPGTWTPAYGLNHFESLQADTPALPSLPTVGGGFIFEFSYGHLRCALGDQMEQSQALQH